MKSLKILSIAAIRNIPIIFAVCIVVSSACLHFIGLVPALEALWFIYYVLQIGAYLVLSLTFKFCIYHRLIIYFILITFTILNIDRYIGLSISSITLFATIMLLAFATLIAVIITYLKYGDRKISQKDKLTD